MNDNQLIAYNSTWGIVTTTIVITCIIYCIYSYESKKLAFNEKMMSNGYVLVRENGDLLWKPSGVKFELEKK